MNELTKIEQPLTNAAIAEHLDDVAELLDGQQANPYRINAYRAAAATLRELSKPAHVILQEEGFEGLVNLPTIGQSIAGAIEQLICSGRLNLLERLRGETNPERVLASVPGIGPKLATRIHHTLDIETLPELENAAYDGRLEKLAGFGTGRLRAVRESLAGRLHRRARPVVRQYSSDQPVDAPPVAELLDIDREYREKAKAHQLPRIAPRRYNPTHEAWLPILHTARGSTQYTALYSNTARAHELDMTHDWVVIYRDDRNGNGQWTVITSQYGPLRGKRIVRGREQECFARYEQRIPSEGC